MLRYRMPWGNSWRKRADQRCSAISFWTRHPPNWARHRVDHGTITGRGGDKFGPRKAVFACNGCAFSPRPPREKIVRVMSAGVVRTHGGVMVAVLIASMFVSVFTAHELIITPCRATTKLHTVTDNLGDF